MIFYNYNPVKLIHGDAALEKAGVEIPDAAVVTVIHGTTLDRYADRVIKTIAAWRQPSRVTYLRVGPGEPTEGDVDALVRQIDPKTDFVLGLGGGSVLDTTKAICVCLGNKIVASQLKHSSPMTWSRTMKFGLIGTRPGSGSECNNAFVLMDAQTNFKRSYFSLFSYPKFAIHDPIFFESLDQHVYSSGLADAVSHVIDQYLVAREPHIVQDSMSLDFLRIGSELSKAAGKAKVADFLQLAWLSSMISSGILSRGVKTSWILHEVAHSLASVLGIRHADSIAMVSRSVFSLERHPQDRLANVVSRLSPSQEQTAKDQAALVERIVGFFSGLGLPVGLEALRQDERDLWRGNMRALCPNLTDEEVSQLCTPQ